jgi:SAM-dependent methyltransferase
LPSISDLIERPRCPVCGAAPGRTLYHAAFDEPPLRDYLFRTYPGLREPDLELLSDAEYVLDECSACTLVWQRFAPTERLLALLYETWAADDGGLARQDNLDYHRSIAEEVLLVVELAGRRPSEVAVLDFGMGWGRWARMAAAFGCRAYGVEPAEPQAGYARSQGVTVLTLDELPDATFDFVNCEQVFEHLVDPRATITRLARSLAPQGWMKINVPEGRGIAERLRSPDWSAGRRTSGSLVAVAPLEHLNCFNKRALDALAAQGGLGEARPEMAAVYAATIGLWPPRRFARGLVRPPLRRVAPRAAPRRATTTPGARFYRPVR